VRTVAPAVQSALAARALVARDFLWIVARTRADPPVPVSVGFWSDIENVSGVQVIDPDTLTTATRSYYGAGGLIAVDDIPSVSSIQVQDIHIRMSQLDEQVETAVRTYDVKQARVEIHRGWFDPVSRQLVSPAIIRFVGFVNTVEIHTPAEGGDGYVNLTCVSHTQETTRSNPATRSHADQQNRAVGDDFFIDAATVGDWQFSWGEDRSAKKVETQKGIFGWGGWFFGL
jgi:hypothetical protein